MLPSEQKRPLKHMFDMVPERYDLINRLLTVGWDERWRRRAARQCLAGGARRVLDLCCGTGDLALHLARESGGSSEIVAVDYSALMLAIARRKALRAGAASAVRFVEGDAAALAFPDQHFDAVGIAFAFRNLTWRNPVREAALAELRRVLRPGGRFVVVETSQPDSRLLRSAFHVYLSTVTASVGASLSGHGSAYRYLAESARNYYGSAQVSAILHGAGFAHVSCERLLGGIAAIHVAI